MSSISCIICQEDYTSADEICSNTCGHMYHQKCIDEWKERSQTCPECRHYNLQLQRIFPTFEESVDVQQEIVNLKAQLNEKVEHESSLTHQLDQRERDLLQLNIQYTKLDDQLKDSNETLKYLRANNERKDNEMIQKSVPGKTASQMKLHARIRTLNDIIQQTNEAVAKQIQVSNDLIVDKLRLEISLNSSNIPSTSSRSEHQATIQAVAENKKTEKQQNKCNAEGEAVAAQPLQDAHGIVIKGLSETDLQEPLINALLTVTQSMRISFSIDNIENLRVLPDNLLLVTFKTPNLKYTILKNKYKLKFNEPTKNLFVEAYMPEYILLLEQAQALKKIGYKIIYQENKIVYAKLNPLFAPIRINSVHQVEAMMKTTVNHLDFAHDENYYAK